MRHGGVYRDEKCFPIEPQPPAMPLQPVMMLLSQGVAAADVGGVVALVVDGC